MSQNPMYALLDATAREGQRFAEQFFREVDGRTQAPPSVLPDTKVVWNGTPIAGPQGFRDMLAQSPEMQHEVSGLDVQPFPNGDVNSINMLVNTSGRVKIGGTLERDNDFAFSAQLVVRRPQPGSALVLQTVGYRLVHKPPKSSLQV